MTELQISVLARGRGTMKCALVIAFACLALLGLVSIALAQSGGSYDLSWWTVDGGGYTFSTGGDYTLGGTIGQADAGVLLDGDYTLVGGLWSGADIPAGPETRPIYLPVVLKNYP